MSRPSEDFALAQPARSSRSKEVIRHCFHCIHLKHSYTTMSAMAKAQKSKAEDFIDQAEKTLSKKSWFASGKERNLEEAVELYEKAANAYKVGGLNQEAGDMYVKAAEIHRDQLTNLNEASKDFSSAGTYEDSLSWLRRDLVMYILPLASFVP